MLSTLKGKRKVCRGGLGERSMPLMEKGQDRRVFRKMEAAGEKSEGEGIETDGARITAEKRVRRRERGRQSVSD